MSVLSSLLINANVAMKPILRSSESCYGSRLFLVLFKSTDVQNTRP